MARHGKKYVSASAQAAQLKELSVAQVLTQVKNLAFANFDESVDVHVNLGIDASKGDQAVRGSVLLPHNTGKKARVIVFAKGDYADEARAAGADHVGMEDLIEKVEGGWLDFEYAVATPDEMGKVGRLAKILGPRNLLPNKKQGTVTFDVKTVVANLKKGLSFFKNDKSGIVHFSFGRKSLTVDQLRDNLVSFVKALSTAKPPSSKGKFLKKITVASTMGIGIIVNPEEVIRLAL
jgi:large subunit ribosomal protein L1